MHKYLQRVASVGATPPELAGEDVFGVHPQVTLRCTCGSLDMLLRYTSLGNKRTIPGLRHGLCELFPPAR